MGVVMKFKYLWLLGFVISFLGTSVSSGPAQNDAHQAAMSALESFFADPTARADYASKNAEALQAEQSLLAFPPSIQKRLEKVVLMIMQESGANAARHLDAAKISGPEGAFNTFSPAVQKEIQEIAKELEKDPEFMKKAGYLK
jgi:hypothetical protein